MPTAFTNEEYADMILAYGRADGNASEARRIYHERYPDRRLPGPKTFSNTFRRLRETGNLHFREPHINESQYDDSVEHILQMYNADPNTSIRKIAAQFGFSKSKVWRVLEMKNNESHEVNGEKDAIEYNLRFRKRKTRKDD